MKFSLLVLFFISVFYVNAQVIPAANRVDWSNPGYQGTIPNPSTVANVRDFGALGDGINNDYSSIISAINSLNGGEGVVFFPAGTYLVNSTIKIPEGVILRGESSVNTILKFNLSSSGYDCILISKAQTTAFHPLTGGFSKGSASVGVQDASFFSPGDYAEIRQKNGAWDIDPKSYATYCVGQVVRITKVEGNNLTFERGLRINYDQTLNPEIRKIEPIRNVGIEFLKIIRDNDATPTSGAGYNISFKYAANCWVKGVESDKSIGSHILADVSTNLQITGCYFHDAFTYDGSGTRGYGVTLIQHTGECLIENNIFRHLRHAMMVKQGANGNVFGYNYSIEPHRSEQYSDYGGDISLHGHYAFANLFEGNIVRNIHIDQTGGPSGPYNTFFRNRAELYGIWMTSGSVQSDYQNFVGNEVTRAKNCVLEYFGFCYIYEGNYEKAGSGHFEYGNNIRYNTADGIIEPLGTANLEDLSYYKSSVSTFNTTETSSSIGSPSALGSGTNDAEDRYKNDPVKTYPQYSDPLPIELLSFEASIEEGKVMLEWKTTKEINNDYYTIEKSTDGKEFQAVKTIDGAGNAEELIIYKATDESSISGRWYYRLKQTDFNGLYSYSKIISITIPKQNQAFLIYPNPNKTGEVNIEIPGNREEEIGFEIWSIHGIRKYSGKLFFYKRERRLSTIKLPEGFPAGTYYFVLNSGFLPQKQMFVKY